MLRLFLFLLHWLGPHWKIPPVVTEYLSASGRLGRNDQIPLELDPLTALLWGRGWLNRQFFDAHRDWVLPYWAVHQLRPSDAGFVARGLQPVVLNSTYRDWTAIGDLDSPYEAIVDPRGLVTPRPLEAGWSLDAWLRVGEQLFVPSQLEPPYVEQRLHESLPLVQTRYEAAGLRVHQEAFGVRTAQAGDWAIAAVTVENPRNDPRTATLYFGVRPFNPEGVSLIRELEFQIGEPAYASFRIDGSLGGVISKPDRVGCSDERAGDVAFQIPDMNGSTRAVSGPGLATGAAAYDLELHPHSSRLIAAALPMTTVSHTPGEAMEWITPEHYPQLRRAIVARWREVLEAGMQIQVPDERVQEAFDANKAYLLLLHDGDSITPGPFTYHRFSFRSAAYMLNALDQLGYHDRVTQVLRTYRQRLQKNGYMLAQEGEWDSNGQALWSLVQNARLSGDLELVARDYWQMLNAAHWIDAERQKTKASGERSPHHGLLPTGLSAEHLGPTDYYYWDDFWGLAGLQTTEHTARLFGKEEDARKLKLAFDAFCDDVNQSLAAVARRTGEAWMPASPYRGADSSMVANLVALYPLQLMAADDPRIVATLEALKRTAWRDGAFFHDTGHSGYGAYLALRIAGCYIYQRSGAAWPIINWLLEHASPTYTWAEALNPRTLHGGMGDGHDGWTAADWISIVRNTLLFEEGSHLVITPALPKEWTYETMALQVRDAATYFGKVSWTIAFGQRAATLVLKPAWREPPEYVEWNLPFTLKDAGGDQPGVALVNNRVRIPGNVTRVVAQW